MKVEVLNKVNGLPFPKLMKYKDDHNLIVLFTKEDCGICLSQDKNNYHKLFEYHERWITNEFVDFDKNIILSN